MNGDPDSLDSRSEREPIIIDFTRPTSDEEAIYHGTSRLIRIGYETVIRPENSAFSLLISLGPRNKFFLLYSDEDGVIEAEIDFSQNYFIQEDMNARDPNNPSSYGALILYACSQNGQVIGKTKLKDSVEGTAFMGNGLSLIPTEEGVSISNKTGKDMLLDSMREHPEILSIVGLQEGEVFHDIKVDHHNIGVLNFLLKNDQIRGRLYSMFHTSEGETLYSLIHLVEAQQLNALRIGHLCTVDQNGNLQYVRFTPNENSMIGITTSLTDGIVNLQVDGINLERGGDLYLQYEGEIIYIGKVIEGYVELMSGNER